MNREEFVDLIEIWIPTKKGGEAFHFEKKENLKRVVVIINGYPILLEEGFYMTNRLITKEEAKHYETNKQTNEKSRSQKVL